MTYESVIEKLKKEHTLSGPYTNFHVIKIGYNRYRVWTSTKGYQPRLRYTGSLKECVRFLKSIVLDKKS